MVMKSGLKPHEDEKKSYKEALEEQKMQQYDT